MGERVVVVGWELPPIFIHGGLGVYEYHLGKALKKKGYDVVFVGALPRGFDDLVGKMIEKDEFMVYPIASVDDLGPRNVAELRTRVVGAVDRILGEGGVRAVVVNDLHAVTAVDPAIAHGVPVAYVIHTISGDMIEGGYAFLLGKVVTNSRLMADSLRDVFASMAPAVYPPVNPPEVLFTYPGVPEVSKPKLEDIDRYRSLSGSCEFVIGVLGRWAQPNKRLHWLIDIVKKLREDHGLDVCGLIGGVGVPEGVSDHVRLCGYIPRHEKGAFLKALDVFVLTSEFEPFGLVAVEAVSMGVPAVVPDASGVAEVLGFGEIMRERVVYKAKDLDDVTQKVADLLINKNLYVDAVVSERSFVRSFMSWDYVADFLLMVADEVSSGI